MQADPDIDLIQQLQEGNRNAFDTLFRKYYKALCRFSCLIAGDAEDAEEAVQTAFITIWENRDSIHIQKSFKSYLYQIVKNNILMLIRKKRTRIQYENQFTEIQEAMVPEDKVMGDEEIAAYISKGMEALPEKCRMIFSLSRTDGLTYEEIAEYLDISPKTVENQMGIALQKLRSYLLPIWKKLLVFLGVVWVLGHLITKHG